MIELKPCPFCGEQVTLSIAKDYTGKIIYADITCDRCKAYIGRGDREEAIEAWNRRVTDEIH